MRQEYRSPLHVFIADYTMRNKNWKVNISTPYHTIEFRQLESTFRLDYVLAWTRLVVQFVFKARKMSMNGVFDHIQSKITLGDFVGADLYGASMSISIWEVRLIPSTKIEYLTVQSIQNTYHHGV